MAAARLEDHTFAPAVCATVEQLLSAADAATNRIAERIGDNGDKQVVAVCSEEGLALLLCQLAIMQANCVFLLVDPTLPHERISYLLSDSAAVLLLCESSPSFEPNVPLMEIFEHAIVEACDPADDALSELFSPHLAQQLMYICYTSGSTGRPKGCAISRASLHAYAHSNAQAHGMGSTSRILLASAVSFDPCIGEAWTALLAGGTLCLPSRAMVKASLGALLIDTRATHVCSTPALWSTVLGGPGAYPALQCVTLGGERMPVRIMDTWTRGACRLYNIYGVTECTVYQASRRILERAGESDTGRSEESAWLGAALAANSLHLLDEQLMPIPSPSDALASSQGQIAISGDQLALGYLHRAALTAERFVTPDSMGRVRVYLTGDLARWATTTDGMAPVLRLCGRTDNQVKLNGVRFELGEVEGVLSSCDHIVRYVAALLVGGRLVAAVEPCQAAHAETRLLREACVALLVMHVRRQLPAQLCPTEIVMLTSPLPLTSTGKLDRLALRPVLETALAATASDATAGGGDAGAGGAVEPPSDALEVAVADAWRCHLHVPMVSRRSDFRRLGGDSIKALQVTRALALALGGEAGSADGDGARFLGGTAPPAPGESLAEVAEAADYGVMRGVFAPSALLRLPLLYRYAEYLRAHGVCAEGEASQVVGSSDDRFDEPLTTGAAPPPEASERTRGGAELIDAETEAATAVEAAAAEESELLGSLERMLSEVAADTSLEQPILQLALSIAARSGDAAIAATALHLGGHPAPRPADKLRGGSVVNERGLPPLHIAAEHGRTEVVRMLLEAAASPTLLSTAGTSALVVAAQSEHSTSALEMLISAGATLKMRDSRRQTALHAAARVGCTSALRVLIPAAIAEGKADEARRAGPLPSQKDPPIELRDRWNRTALHWAVVNQQAEAMDLLIAAGASVQGVPMKQKKHSKATHLPLESPLHSAARLPPNAAAPLVRVLLAASADVHHLDQFGQTPLHVAAAACGQGLCTRCAVSNDGAVAVLFALLGAGAVVECKDHSGRTALDLVHQFAGGEPAAVTLMQQGAKAEGLPEVLRLYRSTS